MTSHEVLEVGTYAGQAMDALSNTVWPILWSLVLLIGLLIAWWYLSYRHKVRIRMLTGSNPVPFDDKAREIKVDGVTYWKLLKRKDVIAVPDSQSLEGLGKDIMGKPKFYAEMYWSEEHGYIPIVDDVNESNFLDRIVVKDGKKLAKGTFKPFTTQQRTLLVTQLRKAQDRRKKSLLDQVMQVAVPMMLVFLFIMVLVFWEDIAKPAKDMAEMNQNMMSQQRSLLEQSQEISNQNARIVKAFADKEEAEALQLQQRIREEAST